MKDYLGTYCTDASYFYRYLNKKTRKRHHLNLQCFSVPLSGLATPDVLTYFV